MTKSRFLAICAASLLILGLTALATPTQEADDDAAGAPGTAQTIGLVDTGYIFKNYPRLTEAMAGLKAEVDAAEAEVKKERETLTGMQKQLKLEVVGTPAYTELLKRITTLQAEMAGSVQAQKNEFLRREARLYYDADQEITREVEDYAQAHNLSVVLRFTGASPNVNDPKQVLTYINRPIVWHDGGRDLTRIILQRMVEKSKEPEEGKEPSPEDTKEPTPEPPTEPKQENHHGESQRASHFG